MNDVRNMWLEGDGLVQRCSPVGLTINARPWTPKAVTAWVNSDAGMETERVRETYRATGY